MIVCKRGVYLEKIHVLFDVKCSFNYFFISSLYINKWQFCLNKRVQIKLNRLHNNNNIMDKIK